jgi:hypothetical protein
MKVFLKSLFVASLLLLGMSGNLKAQCDGTIVNVTVTGGAFAAEISWSIFSSEDNTSVLTGNAPASATACLDDGCYTVVMSDSFGDGWNGAQITITTSEGTILLITTLNSGSSGTAVFGVNASDCVSSVVPGCTDPEALNYNPTATEDNGTCTYTNNGGGGGGSNTGCNSTNCDGICANFYLCTFSNGQNVGISIVSSQGDTVFFQSGFNNVTIMFQTFCIQPGECYTVQMWNNAGQNGWYNGYWWLNVNGQQIINESLDNNLSFEVTNFGIGASCPLEGCTDPTATNFNPNATDDNGSCVYPEPCLTNSVFATFTPGLFASEVSWMITNEDGLVVASGGGYFSNSSVSQQICLPDGCYILNMYDSFGDGWNGASLVIVGSGVIYLNATLTFGAYGQVIFNVNSECDDLPGIEGCTNPIAWNYNPAATIDDGSCQFGGNEIGCTDPYASNFNPYASIDDGSCFYDNTECLLNEVVALFNPGTFPNEVSWTITTESGQVWAAGGPYFFNTQTVTHILCLPDSCMTLNMYDSFGDGWNGASLTLSLYSLVDLTFSLPSGSFSSVPFNLFGPGCDGIEVIYGCTDPMATNFNPLATVNDGSCEYPQGDCEISFQVIVDGNGENVLWVVLDYSGTGELSVLWDFGDGNYTWDAYPSYTYTEDGDYMLCAFVYATNNNGGLDCYNWFCDTISSDVFIGMGLDGKPNANRQNGFSINVVPSSWLSLQESTQMEMAVFPNPFGNDFQVISPALREERVTIDLFDANGRIVKSEELNNFASDVWRANAEALPAGLYVLSVRTNQGITRHRLIKQ